MSKTVITWEEAYKEFLREVVWRPSGELGMFNHPLFTGRIVMNFLAVML